MLDYFSNQTKGFQRVSVAAVVLIVAIAGTYFLTGSHAASPNVNIDARSGTATNGAVAKSCSGSNASNGQCVVFGSTSGNSNMIVGMNAGGWNTGNPGDDDVASAVNYARLDYTNCPNPVAISYPVSGAQYTNCPAGGDIIQLAHDGTKVDLDFSGPYNTGGVSALVGNGSGATAWANNAISWYTKYCGSNNTECPIIEVLNEPDGSWFWGTGANNQTNATAYANLVKTTYNAFHTAYGTNAPLILTAYDNNSWGGEWWNAIPNMGNYVDGVIVHPYGQTGMNTTNAATIAASFAASAAGNRQQAIDAHGNTCKPVYITEVGWPTDDPGPTATTVNETGDSLQWPEADSSNNAYAGLDQCDNVYNFVNWARGTGYVNAVMIYGYINSNTNNAQYGLEFYDNTNGNTRHKPGWFALKAAGLSQPNPCPSAANNYAQPS